MILQQGQAELLLLSGLLSLLYPIAVYPSLLALLKTVKKRAKEPNRPLEQFERVSVLIAVHNVEGFITEKIAELLSIKTASPTPMEIVVVLDGCTDGTLNRLELFQDQIVVVNLKERVGKQAALNLAVERAVGDVLLFTDAAVFFSPSTCTTLLRRLASSDVGAVTGMVKTVQRLGSSENLPTIGSTDESGYLNLDYKLRKLESDISSTIVCTGALYAIKKKYWKPFLEHGASDLQSALDCLRHGVRVILAIDCVGYVGNSRSGLEEVRRKARTVTQGIATFFYCGAYNPFRYGFLTAWMLWSHKLMRWMIPVSFFVVGVGLAALGHYQTTVKYFSLGLVLPVSLGSLLLTLTLTNTSALRAMVFLTAAVLGSSLGLFYFIIGRKFRAWAPTERNEVAYTKEKERRSA